MVPAEYSLEFPDGSSHFLFPTSIWFTPLFGTCLYLCCWTSHFWYSRYTLWFKRGLFLAMTTCDYWLEERSKMVTAFENTVLLFERLHWAAGKRFKKKKDEERGNQRGTNSYLRVKNLSSPPLVFSCLFLFLSLLPASQFLEFQLLNSPLLFSFSLNLRTANS